MHDSLYFSDHHLQVREMVRDFAKNVVKPTARQYDLESRFPWDNVKQMAELGLFGIPWPEELGGSGMDYLSYITVIHELAKVDASHAITVSAHTTLGTAPIRTPNAPTASPPSSLPRTPAISTRRNASGSVMRPPPSCQRTGACSPGRKKISSAGAPRTRGS